MRPAGPVPAGPVLRGGVPGGLPEVPAAGGDAEKAEDAQRGRICVGAESIRPCKAYKAEKPNRKAGNLYE